MYTRYPHKHFLSHAHSGFRRQLRSFMSVGVASFSKLVLWFRVTLDIFGIQLQLILILFLLNNLRYLWCHGKCLSTSRRNILPMLVFTLTLYDGSKHNFSFTVSSWRGCWCELNFFIEATDFKCVIICGCSFIKPILYYKLYQIFFYWPSMVFVWW